MTTTINSVQLMTIVMHFGFSLASIMFLRLIFIIQGCWWRMVIFELVNPLHVLKIKWYGWGEPIEHPIVAWLCRSCKNASLWKTPKMIFAKATFPLPTRFPYLTLLYVEKHVFFQSKTSESKPSKRKINIPNISTI